MPYFCLTWAIIKVADLHTGMLQHMRFDLIIGGFTLRRCQIQLVQIQLHLDMLLGIEFGQKYYRLQVLRQREVINRYNALTVVVPTL